MRAENDPILQAWPQKETNRFISAANQNEILKDMAIYIIRTIKKHERI